MKVIRWTVYFIMLDKVHVFVTVSSLVYDHSKNNTVTTEKNFHVVLLIILNKVVLTFKSVDET